MSNEKDITEPFLEVPQASPPAGYEIGSPLDDSPELFVGSDGNNIFAFNGNIEYEVSDSAGDDFYVIGKYQVRNVVIDDSMGDNKLYFDDGVNIISAFIELEALKVTIGENTNIATITINEFVDFEFYLGSDTVSMTANEILSLTPNHEVDGFADIDLTASSIAPSSQYSAFVQGGSGVDVFTLGFSQDGGLFGGIGADNYYLTRFQSSTFMEIDDGVGGDNFIIEGGVEIDSISVRVGAYVLNLEGGGEVQINAGANYTYYLREYKAGEGIVAAKFLADHDTEGLTLAPNNTNEAPTVANEIANQTATEDSSFSFTFADTTFADEDADNVFTYTAPNLPNWLSFDVATRTFTGTPLNEHVGEHNIVVTATDSAGIEISDTFIITVANTNDAPTGSTIPPQRGIHKQPFSLDLSDYFDDDDVDDELTYSVVGLPDGLILDTRSGIISGAATSLTTSAIAIMVTVTDSGGLTATVNFDLTIARNVIERGEMADNLSGTAAADDIQTFAGDDTIRFLLVMM